MTKREMVDELLERLETELDELSVSLLTSIIIEYEHSSLLSSVIEGLDDLIIASDDEEDIDEEESLLIDGDFDEADES